MQHAVLHMQAGRMRPGVIRGATIIAGADRCHGILRAGALGKAFHLGDEGTHLVIQIEIAHPILPAIRPALVVVIRATGLDLIGHAVLDLDNGLLHQLQCSLHMPALVGRGEPKLLGGDIERRECRVHVALVMQGTAREQGSGQRGAGKRCRQTTSHGPMACSSACACSIRATALVGWPPLLSRVAVSAVRAEVRAAKACATWLSSATAGTVNPPIAKAAAIAATTLKPPTAMPSFLSIR